jgi:hypothetical protein
LVEPVRVAAAIRPGILGQGRLVLLNGGAASATVVDRRWIQLADPSLPESHQPYYEENGALRKNGPELERLMTAVERFGRQSLIETIDRQRDEGQSLVGIAIILGTLAHPDRVDNARMRGYALEQRLFRRVIESASAERNVPSFIFCGRDLLEYVSRAGHEERSAQLGLPAPPGPPVLPVISRIAGLRRASFCEVEAALAAWFVLTDSREIMG